MPAANARSHAISASRASTDSSDLFKEDRPRRIDLFISFFGETEHEDPLLESVGSDPWSER